MDWIKKVAGPCVPPHLRKLRIVLLIGLLAAACGYRVWLVFSSTQWIPSGATRGGIGLGHPRWTPSRMRPSIHWATRSTSACWPRSPRSQSLVAYWTALLSLSGPWLWYRFLRELLPSRDWALAGWVVLAALPSWSAIYSYFMQETLMLPLLGPALWATWRCRRKARYGQLRAGGRRLAARRADARHLHPARCRRDDLAVVGAGGKARGASRAVLLLGVMGPLAGRSWNLVRQISPHGIGTMVQIYRGRAPRASRSSSLGAAAGSAGLRVHLALADEGPFAPLSDWQSEPAAGT